MRIIKFKVTGLGFLSGGTYDNWEEAVANLKDSKGRTGTIIVEMTGKEYYRMVNGYRQKLNELNEMIRKRDYDHKQNIIQQESQYQQQLNQLVSQLKEKDKRCATLAAVVNRLKNKQKSN